jgi:serine/threonine protein kinase
VGVATRRRGGAKRSARVFHDRWEVVRPLGGGGQGTAYLVRDLKTDSRPQWVLKELRDQKSDSPARRTKRLRRFEREIAALGRLNLSPNIPSVVDSHVGLDGSYLVTPYAGKNLEKLPKLVDPQAILQRFRGFVQAVKYTNDREVVHRDIRPNNTTVNDDGTTCLVDFGICMYDDKIGLTDTMEGFGNRYFAAPECDAGNPEPIGPPSDIYSLGKLLHWMATDRGKMGREDFDEEAFTFTDRFARQYFSVLIKHTVCERPGARWSATELLDHIDWVLAKLAEHAAIREKGLTVLVDNFGPNDACYENSSRSAMTGYGDPPADYELAHSFFVGEAVVLDRLDIRLAGVAGRGKWRSP